MYITKKKLIVVAVFLLIIWFISKNASQKNFSQIVPQAGAPEQFMMGDISRESKVSNSYIPNEIPPVDPTQIKDKLVIRDGNISLVVKNISETKDKIITQAEQLSGYLVSADTYGLDNDSRATVVIRVPEPKFTDTLSFIRALGVKVTSESVSGQDVTEEFVDLEGRLKSLQASRSRFQEILQNASTVDQILTVQREIDRVQMQIEQTTGRMEFLKKSSQMSKISVNLALDEESLPYVAPSEKWRPQLIFKQAIRALLVLFKDFSYILIWIIVFGVVWVPVLLIAYFIKRRFWKKVN